MRPTSSFLVYRMKRQLEIVTSSRAKDWMENQPLLLPKSTAVSTETGRIVLIKVQEWAANQNLNPASFYIVYGEGSCLLRNEELTFIQVSSIHNAAEILDVVTSCFEEWMMWQEELDAFRQGQRSFQQVLQKSYLLFENSLALVEHQLQYVAVYDERLQSEVSAVEPLGEEQFLSQQHIDLIAKDIVKNKQQRQPFLYTNPQLPYQTILVNIYQQDLYLGTLGITNLNRNFKDFDFLLAKHLASYLKEKLAADRMNHKDEAREVRQLVKRLFTAPAELTTEERKCLISYGWQPTETYQVICLQRKPFKAAIPYTYEGYFLEQLLGKTIAIVEKNAIILIGQFDKEEYLQNQLESFLKKGALIGGVSNSFYGINKSYYGKRQAQQALAFADEKQPLAFFSKHKLTCCLRTIVETFPYELLITEEIEALLTHDKEAVISYLDTLNCYLVCGMNAQKAARRLHIQRNTLLARLNRIFKLIGHQMEDEQDRLYFQLFYTLKTEQARFFSPISQKGLQEWKQ